MAAELSDSKRVKSFKVSSIAAIANSGYQYGYLNVRKIVDGKKVKNEKDNKKSKESKKSEKSDKKSNKDIMRAGKDELFITYE